MGLFLLNFDGLLVCGLSDCLEKGYIKFENFFEVFIR